MLETRGYDKLQDDEINICVRCLWIVCARKTLRHYQKKGDKEAELNKVKETSIQKMWLRELRTLEKEYEQYKIDRANRSRGVTTKKKKKKVKKTKLSYLK